MKNRLLFWIGLICGVTPIVVASILFLNFWILRTFYAIPLSVKMENYNLYWVLLSLPLISLSFGILLYCYHKNRPLSTKKIFIAMFIILLNIPIGRQLINEYMDMHLRVYVKLSNKSNLNLTSVEIKGTNFTKELGTLNNNASVVFNYYPRYADGLPYSSIYPKANTVQLTAMNNSRKILISFPRFDIFECKTLYISKALELIEE
jgi:hypothetical protein